MANTLTLNKQESLSLAASGASSPLSISGKTLVAIQCYIDNTDAVGTISIQGSNDKSNWVDLTWFDENQDPQTEYAVSSGTDVNQLFDLAWLGVHWVRVYWTRTAGGAAQTVEITCAVK
jgi:hypothetical protein